MSKPIKEMIARDLETRYAGTDNAVWIELVGLDGITTNQFRRDLRGRHMHLEIVKTSLFKRACAKGPMARLAEKVEGPVALVTGGVSAVDVGKLLDEWTAKLAKNLHLRVRGALLEGEYLDEAAAKDLSKMPTRADLQGRIVQIIITPGSRLVSTFLSPGAKIAGILKSLIEKLEKEPAAEAAPAEAAVVEAAAPAAGPAPEAGAAPAAG
jgi:large subunit ribosomal protein L10